MITILQGALAVAVLNVYIPKIMADLVNVIAKLNGTMESKSFVAEARQPALKLVGMYLAQVRLITSIISVKYIMFSEYFNIFLYLYALYPGGKNGL